ncbi:hypothetical protein PoMZ_06543 [Pyricularia oryzae]|uniref:Uncharacterized protein n=1 Tax=Pyricularia oryzae TaxID=318829 RepID=A0A4P7NRE9_PYROR|nr:hypothetical protein PoMZ_06543 [Pyricularia oryzae]
MVQSPEPRFGEECFIFVISSMVLLYWLFIPSTAIILFLFSFFLFSLAHLYRLLFPVSSLSGHTRIFMRAVVTRVDVCFGMSRSVRHHEG